MCLCAGPSPIPASAPHPYVHLFYAGRRGKTPLLCAVSTGNLRGCELLHRRGANVQAENVDGSTAVDLAAQSSARLRKWAEDLDVSTNVPVTGAGRCRPFFILYDIRPATRTPSPSSGSTQFISGLFRHFQHTDARAHSMLYCLANVRLGLL